jgi:hypothetical protein
MLKPVSAAYRSRVPRCGGEIPACLCLSLFGAARASASLRFRRWGGELNRSSYLEILLPAVRAPRRRECNAGVKVTGVSDEPRRKLGHALLTPLALAVIVSGVTLLTDAPGRSGLAASARQVFARGQVWRLVTSGTFVQRPYAASLGSFALLACLAFVFCGRGVFWCSALAGHVGSAVPVYLLVGLGWTFEPEAFRNAWTSSDYGVSAISAAWLGAIAAAGWSVRGATWKGRGAIALSCITVAMFAFTRILRNNSQTASDFREVIFPASWRACRRVLKSVSLAGRLDPVVAGTLVATGILIGGSLIPSAVAGLSRKLLDSHESRGRCNSLPFSIAMTEDARIGLRVTCQTVRDAT